MKLNSFSKQAIGLGAVVALGFGVVGTASANTPFNVNATVQNALVVTNVNDMNLGTVFATKASTGFYRYMTLSPAGTFNNSLGSAATTLISLGGAAAATGSVNALTTAPFTVVLPTVTANLVNTGDATYTLTGSAVDVQSLSSPATSARFTLVNFRAGNPTNGTADTGCSTASSCQITPAATGAVTFKIGATLVTGQNAQTDFVTGAYQGTFNVSATY